MLERKASGHVEETQREFSWGRKAQTQTSLKLTPVGKVYRKPLFGSNSCGLRKVDDVLGE